MTTELYINGLLCDLSEGIAFPLSYSISDFKEPQNRQRSVSKTIVLNGTITNKRIFDSAYELSIYDDGVNFNFDPTTRVPARVVRNSREIFRGLCQLLQVNYENGNYTFEIVLFSNFINIFQKLEEINIGELGWQEYNHPLTYNVVNNSWDSSVIKNGVATPNFTTGVPDSFGYVYPWIDFGYQNSNITLNINDLVPYVYVKEIFEKAFESLGYTIDSDFFETDLFKSLIFGFGGGKKHMIPPADSSDREVDVDADGVYNNPTRAFVNFTNGNNTYQGSYTIPLSNFTPTINSDGYSQYNSGQITVSRTGNYSLDLDFSVLISGNSSGGTIVTNATLFKVEVLKNGTVIHSTNGVKIPSTPTAYNVDTSIDLNLNSGDVIDIKFYYTLSDSGITVVNDFTSYDYEFELDLNSDFNINLISQDSLYLEGDVITLNRFIPNMKVVDFLKGVMTMFNLTLDDDNEEGVVKIEPLNGFYKNSSDAEIWSEKVDYSKRIEIKSPSVDLGKSYNFKFAEDNDFYSEKYKRVFEHGYGNYLYNLESGYSKGNKEFKLPFNIPIPVEERSDFVIPRFINIDADSGVVEPNKGKPKIMFYNGLKSGQININTASGILSIANYPQVHHSFEDIKNPTFDLTFKAPDEVYYSFTNYNNANLFNNYHRAFIRELTSRDAKVLTCYVKLDNSDIYDGMFRYLVNIDGVLYRKNLINDYDATGNEVTKVELIKVIETTDIVYSNPTIVIGTGLSGTTSSVIRSPLGVGAGTSVISGGINTGLYTRNVRASYGTRIL